MILQALKEYYDRKSSDPESGIAPLGWEWKEIPNIAVLDKEGELVDLISTVKGSGKNKTVQRFLVPQSVSRTGQNIPNFLWDTAEFTLGVLTQKSSPEQIRGKHESFCKRVENIDFEDAGIAALKVFLQRPDKAEQLERFPEELANMQKDNGYVVFRVEGTKYDIVTESPKVKQAVAASLSGTDDTKESVQGLCLISGEPDQIERTHTSIKGVWGGQPMGGKIVSFDKAAFRSYNKEQGQNAPAGKRAVFAYVTALNTMLAKGSKNRMQVGDASTIAWASKPTDFEANFFTALMDPDKDNPDDGVHAVEAIFNAVETGSYAVDKDPTMFYVLGLAPNSARISIRFWQESTLKEIAERITEHFKATEIVHPSSQPKYLSLFRLLISTASQGKADNIPPNLAGEVMYSILSGRPYPRTFLQAAIRRNRAEQQVGYYRAAVIKACLNKNNHCQTNNFKELTVSLDKENKNIGYLLGRLFAVLLRVQKTAETGGDKLADIVDKFYGSASSTPGLAFPSLMRKLQNHLSKIAKTKKELAEYYNNIIKEIIDKISAKENEPVFPANLSLDNQGCFAVGYYHQIYHKKDKPEETTAE